MENENWLEIDNQLNDLCAQREIRSVSAQSDQILRVLFVLRFYGPVNY